MKVHPLVLALAAALSLAACGSTKTSSPADDVDTAIVLLPGPGSAEQLRSGCRATFFDERSFNGSSLTLVGPTELKTFDKGSAQQLKRDIKSVVTGPRATLVLYEKQFLSARWVGFQPDTHEAGLMEKLGFGGRVESMRLTCT
jgi:hypothetical protein